MNMSDYSCGAIKLTNGLNGRIKTNEFSWLNFGFKNPVNNVPSLLGAQLHSATK